MQRTAHHDARKDGKTVEAVGEVHGVGATDDHHIREDHEAHQAERKGDVLEARDEKVKVARDVEREASLDPARNRLGERSARRNGKRKYKVEGCGKADHGLPRELLPRAHALGIVVHDLAVVVDPADGAVAERHEEHDPDEAVGEIGPEQSRNRDGEENERAAHRRRAVLDEMGLGPVGAHGLSEMQVLKAGDHPGTERKPDPHGGERGKHRAQRQVVEDVEGRETVGQRAEKF